MALNQLHLQLIKELIAREFTKLQQIQEGSGWDWLIKDFLVKTKAEQKIIIEGLANIERQSRVDNKAARPAIKTGADQADDDAVTLIDVMKSNL